MAKITIDTDEFDRMLRDLMDDRAAFWACWGGNSDKCDGILLGMSRAIEIISDYYNVLKTEHPHDSDI